MSRTEKYWYYAGNTARLFCSSLVAGYTTMFLMFQGGHDISLHLESFSQSGRKRFAERNRGLTC
ncbi:hypothetical protein B5F07_08930 [Lachnoclostridium sp. An169]|nr:hypothetical protein B5F07_08930 [Lachnoclostridium sp. An169]